MTLTSVEDNKPFPGSVWDTWPLDTAAKIIVFLKQQLR